MLKRFVLSLLFLYFSCQSAFAVFQGPLFLIDTPSSPAIQSSKELPHSTAYMLGLYQGPEPIQYMSSLMPARSSHFVPIRNAKWMEKSMIKVDHMKEPIVLGYYEPAGSLILSSLESKKIRTIRMENKQIQFLDEQDRIIYIGYFMDAL